MARFAIGCLASLAGSMSLEFAVKLAEAALDKGHEVDFWVSGDAVTLAKRGQKCLKDYSFLAGRVGAAMDKGMTLSVCRGCAETRGYREDDTIDHPRLQRRSMDWFLASCHHADRVLLIGGE